MPVLRAPPAGIGLRQPHYAELLNGPALPLPFVEVHSENFFAAGGAPLRVLQAARERWPVSLHGVGLSLGSAAGLDPWHLERLAALVQRIEPLRVSDHACFARAPLHAWGATATTAIAHAADLLPVAFNRASLDIMVEHVDQVQQRLQRTILVENIAAYLRFSEDTLAEPEFFNQLVRRTGCGVLLDVNNLVVNALNQGPALDRNNASAGLCERDDAAAVAAACAWIDALDSHAVGEVHLAGYHEGDELVIDDHGGPVRAPVWQVYQHALACLGPVPTLIEWDTDLPPLALLMEQAHMAGAHLAACAGTTR